MLLALGLSTAQLTAQVQIVYRFHPTPQFRLEEKEQAKSPWFNALYPYDEDSTYFVAMQGAKYGVINPKGEWQIQPEYDAIGHGNNKQFAVSKEGKWGLVAAEDQLLIPTVFDKVLPKPQQTWQCAVGRKWGLLNAELDTILPLQYAELRMYAHHIWARRFANWQLFSSNGTQLLADSFQDIHYQVGYGASVYGNGGYGFVDTLGHLSFPCQFRFPIRFNQYGNAPTVNANDRHYGMRNYAGEIVIPEEFSFLQFGGAPLVVVKGFRSQFNMGLYNQEGQCLLPPEFEIYPVPGLLVVEDGKVGALNWEGDTIVPFDFQHIASLRDSLLLLKRWPHYYIGHRKLPTVYLDSFTQFEKNGYGEYYRVKQNGKYGLWHENQGYAAACQYDEISTLQHGFMQFVRNGGIGLLNAHGREILFYPEAEKLQLTGGGKVLLRQNGKTALLNNQGDTLIGFVHEHLYAMSSGRMLAQKGRNRFALINEQNQMLIPWHRGRIIKRNEHYLVHRRRKVAMYSSGDSLLKQIGFTYNQIAALDNAHYLGKRAGKWCVIDSTGKALSNRYKQIQLLENGCYRVANGGKWGVLNAALDEVIDLQFQHISLANGGCYLVKKHRWFRSKWGLLNPDGSVAIPLEFDRLQQCPDPAIWRCRLNDEWGLVKTDGKVVKTPQFAWIHAFYNPDKELVFSVLQYGKYGLLSKEGTILVPTIAEGTPRILANGLIVATIVRDSTYCYRVYSQEGVQVGSSDFDDLALENGQLYVKKDDKAFTIDTKGIIETTNKINPIFTR